MRGAYEVPVAGGPAVGDKDGAALESIQVKGDTVAIAVTWRGTGRPTDLHIHQGAKGAQLTTDRGAFCANLHTADFPGGAFRTARTMCSCSSTEQAASPSKRTSEKRRLRRTTPTGRGRRLHPCVIPQSYAELAPGSDASGPPIW
ncbi:CHRD domain-containing protein [Streptomyces sp. NPDC048277]|uniref:CHRD domain-containing protein n=1 Tax=Streptomyces sp. NPDC048277 TaxID=3155027 RepID=UPI0033C62DDF